MTDVSLQPQVGVLAIQGDYAAHAAALESCGAEPVEIRNPEQLQSVAGLVLPGGESTTILKFLEKDGFFEKLKDYCRLHPVFGTCAGAILLANQVRHPSQRSLGVLDITVERNSYGRQIHSSIVEAETTLEGGRLEMVFIRAPRILSCGPSVQILAQRQEDPVLVRQDQILAATFHPELSSDRRVHRYFVDMVRSA